MELARLTQQFDKLLASQTFDEDELDPAIPARHLRLLADFDRIATGALSVFDLHLRKHIFLGEGFAKILGWDLACARVTDSDYGDERIHPADRLSLIRAGVHFVRLVLALDPDERQDYKFYADYRTRGPREDYVRVVEQQTVLENDPSGNAWLALSVLDISPDPDPDRDVTCRLLNHKTGDLFVFPPPGEGIVDPLSVREKEILSLVSKGLVSREIADLLYISVNTVNTHRQRIIRKLDVSNTSEAVSYAMNLGFLAG